MCTISRTKCKILVSVSRALLPVGLRRTRLKSHIPWDAASLPHYSLTRKDAARSQHTGLAAYVDSSVFKVVHCRPDLESEATEGAWLEIQTRKSSIVLGYM